MDLPQNQPCGVLGTSAPVVPKPLSLAPFHLLPGKVLTCREWRSGHPWPRQRKTSWCSWDSLGAQKVAQLLRSDQASFPPCPEASQGRDAPRGGTGCISVPAGRTERDFCPLSPVEEHKILWGARYLKGTAFGVPSAWAANAVAGCCQPPPCPRAERGAPRLVLLLLLALFPWPRLLLSSWDACLPSHPHGPVPQLPAVLPPQPGCYAVPFSFHRCQGPPSRTGVLGPGADMLRLPCLVGE